MEQKDDKIIDLRENVKWIGILDYDIRTFDIVMNTGFGTTYNSYFISSERKTLIDVAKDQFSETWLNKLRAVTDPSDISYIVLNHTEPDHSGSLGMLLDIAPAATIVGSGSAIRYLADMINKPFNSIVVKDGDTLDLGTGTLKFIAAPNLHWPDSIFTWHEEERILFTCDVFGAHYCDSGMFSDIKSQDYMNSYKYYFDVIMKPYSRFMIRAIEKIRDLDISLICPGHGPVHSENLWDMVKLSGNYAEEYLKLVEPGGTKRILVAYISAYGYTKQAAGLIASGLSEAGDFNIDLADIETMPPGELESKLVSSDAILIGSPTINQNTLLPVYRLFSLINPIRDKGKMAGAFGSYGWSGEAPKIIAETLRSLKLRVFDETAGFKFAPGGDKKETLAEFGRQFAREFLKYC